VSYSLTPSIPSAASPGSNRISLKTHRLPTAQHGSPPRIPSNNSRRQFGLCIVLSCPQPSAQFPLCVEAASPGITLQLAASPPSLPSAQFALGSSAASATSNPNLAALFPHPPIAQRGLSFNFFSSNPTSPMSDLAFGFLFGPSPQFFPGLRTRHEHTSLSSPRHCLLIVRGRTPGHPVSCVKRTCGQPRRASKGKLREKKSTEPLVLLEPSYASRIAARCRGSVGP
jgi:hypothetical protein